MLNFLLLFYEYMVHFGSDEMTQPADTSGEQSSPIAITNGVNTLNGVNGLHDIRYPRNSTGEPYEVLKQYHSQPGKLRVAGIGAGATGTDKSNHSKKMLANTSQDYV
jgi:hypothetical protein